MSYGLRTSERDAAELDADEVLDAVVSCVRKTLRQQKESGIAIEVSTAGLRKPVGELYPDRAFLEMCLDAGNPVSLSSDAHVAGQLGFRYDDALAMLSDLGVGELAVFERRERRLEPIGAA